MRMNRDSLEKILDSVRLLSKEYAVLIYPIKTGGYMAEFASMEKYEE